jgi:hypothetical protein
MTRRKIVSGRRWIARARLGMSVPHLALLEQKRLVKRISRLGLKYLVYTDSWRLIDAGR